MKKMYLAMHRAIHEAVCSRESLSLSCRPQKSNNAASRSGLALRRQSQPRATLGLTRLTGECVRLFVPRSASADVFACGIMRARAIVYALRHPPSTQKKLQWKHIVLHVRKSDGTQPSIRALKQILKDWPQPSRKVGRKLGWRKTSADEDATILKKFHELRPAGSLCVCVCACVCLAVAT